MFERNFKKLILGRDDGQAPQKAEASAGQASQSFAAGQAMLVMMLFLGALIFSATAITGLLFSYQVKQAIDSEASAKAIFAADAGIENSLWCYYFDFKRGVDDNAKCNVSGTLLNNSSYGTTLTLDMITVGTPPATQEVARGFTIESEGRAGTARRFISMYYAVR